MTYIIYSTIMSWVLELASPDLEEGRKCMYIFMRESRR